MSAVAYHGGVTPWLGLVLCLSTTTAPDGGCAPGPYGQGPVQTSGWACVCDAGSCVPFEVKPVPCRSFADCSYRTTPVLHPVSSTQTPRPIKRRVRPCKDAERDAVCDEATKTCRLVAWKC